LNPLLKAAGTYPTKLRNPLTFLPPGTHQTAENFWCPLSILPGLIRPGFCRRDCPICGALVGRAASKIASLGCAFRGYQVDQSLWLILLFALLAWAASFSKLALQFFQQRLTARVWIDLSNKIHANVLHRIMNIISLGARPKTIRRCAEPYQETSNFRW